MKKKMKPIMAAVLAASMTGSSLSAGVGVIPGGGGMTNVSEVYGAELQMMKRGMNVPIWKMKKRIP